MLNNKQFKLLLENIQSKEEIKILLQKYNIKNYIINNDGSIDVNGDINLYNKKLTELPFKFGNVIGNFDCSHNQLTSLKGAPQIVYDFHCSSNLLINLKGSPQEIGGSFFVVIIH